LTVKEEEEEEEEAFWGREKKAKQSKNKAKKKQSGAKRASKIPATPTLHPPNSPPSLSPVHPGRLPTHYPLKEPGQQKQRALYTYLAHTSHLQFLPPSPPINLTVQNERVLKSHYVGQSLYSKPPIISQKFYKAFYGWICACVNSVDRICQGCRF
jgi:hypothetical protein